MKKEPTKKHNNIANARGKKTWIVPKMRILAVNNGSIRDINESGIYNNDLS
ncbi:hypothetical protein [Emticicia sp. 21SJ11W-3]|uniref:hypothetical protein n=1 Tax=Emticicia sp. 21SJ11W-3 TaxID=2916755 RepID=UPI00209FC983|nr:hypothetical protein [Emticicia sp. 21SJ11W-3]UTA66740.1 hypothetical protein MB380_14135 [Emticicia sp. 21SJ11W-3]